MVTPFDELDLESYRYQPGPYNRTVWRDGVPIHSAPIPGLAEWLEARDQKFVAVIMTPEEELAWAEDRLIFDLEADQLVPATQDVIEKRAREIQDRGFPGLMRLSDFLDFASGSYHELFTESFACEGVTMRLYYAVGQNWRPYPGDPDSDEREEAEEPRP